MTTNIAVAAQIARPTIPFVLKSVLPAETESRLDRICCGAPVAEVYRDESREDSPAQENDVMAEKSPDTLMMEDEGLEAIQRAVERLPEAFRDIIALLSEGKRPQEIAEILGCSPNAATIRCCRARKALRELLKGNLQESGRQ